MPTIDPRIDAYIAESREFAPPILTHLREVIHGACPQVQETMKWSRPHFEYNGLLCGMSAFKAHCGFRFWKGALMFPCTGEREAAGHFARITSVKDLPSKKVLAGYVKQAMLRNDEGAKAPARVNPATPRTLVVPDYFQAALQAREQAQEKIDAAAPASSVNTSTGWRTRRPKRPACAGWTRRSSGSPRQGTKLEVRKVLRQGMPKPIECCVGAACANMVNHLQ